MHMQVLFGHQRLTIRVLQPMRRCSWGSASHDPCVTAHVSQPTRRCSWASTCRSPQWWPCCSSCPAAEGSSLRSQACACFWTPLRSFSGWAACRDGPPGWAARLQRAWHRQLQKAVGMRSRKKLGLACCIYALSCLASFTYIH